MATATRPQPQIKLDVPPPAPVDVSLRLDPRTWLVWTIAAAVIIISSRNPLYIMLVLIAVFLVRRRLSELGGWRGVFRLAVYLAGIAVLFNLLTVHTGNLVLFRLSNDIPVLGGAYTVNALVYGLAAALGLIVLMAVFSVFNRAVEPGEIIRLTPRPFYAAGVVVSIALSFLPNLIKAFGEIRDAQAARGHSFKGWRDSLPILLPLLSSSLERGLQLSEAMESRGFGATRAGAPVNTVSSRWGRVLVGLGLLLFAVGAFVQLWLRQAFAGQLVMLTAGLCVLLGLWLAGRQQGRSLRSRQRLYLADWLVIGASVVTVVAFVGFGGDALYYYPYPTLSLPPFQPLFGLAAMLTALPAFLRPR